MQRKSLLGWWIKLRRRLPAAVVWVAVGVLLIAETAFAQRTQRRMIPDCTSPDTEIRITLSPTKVPIGGTRIVITTLLCNVESLFFDWPQAQVRLVDGDDLSIISPFDGTDRLGVLLASAEVFGGGSGAAPLL